MFTIKRLGILIYSFRITTKQRFINSDILFRVFIMNRRDFIKGLIAGGMTVGVVRSGLTSLLGSDSENTSPFGERWFQPRYASHGSPDYGFGGDVLLSQRKFSDDGESFCEVNIVSPYNSANGSLEMHVREHKVPAEYFQEVLPPPEILGSSKDGHKINDYVIGIGDGEPRIIKIRQTYRDGATIEHSAELPLLVGVGGITRFNQHEDLTGLIQKYDLSKAIDYVRNLRLQNSKQTVAK